MKSRPVISLVFGLLLSSMHAAGEQPQLEQTDENPWAGAIQRLPLEADRPYFLPSNPKVTLTVRFPDQILDADGSGFTTNEAQMPGEYRISWREGDDYMSITQIGKASMRNLNVIVANQTIVLVLYPVDSPLQAITSLTFVPKALAEARTPKQPKGDGRQVVLNSRRPDSVETQTPSGTERSPVQSVVKRDTPPDAPFPRVGPARLLGMIDRMKLLHSTRPDQMDNVLGAMPEISVVDFGTNFDQGMIRLQLYRVVRDSRLDLVGFIVLVRNVTKSEVVIDPESWAARVGLGFFPQAISDSAPKIAPGETTVVYFVVAGDSNGHPGYLKADNEWRISVAIVSPKLNPGANLSVEFAKEIH